MKKYYIYVLFKQGAAFYVGYTTDIKTRMSKHHAAFGKDIVMNIVDELFGTRKEALSMEMEQITKYLASGAKLINGNKISGEHKLTFTYACRPSVRELAMSKADSEGRTISDVIDQLLELYGDGGIEITKKTVVVFGGEEIEYK